MHWISTTMTGAALLIGAMSAAAAPAATPTTGADLRSTRTPAMTCTTSSTEIHLASPTIARTAGLAYTQVTSAPLSRVVERNAEVAYNANRYARLSSRAPGIIIEVRKDLGDTVEKGEVIAIVDSIELGSAKADLLQAHELHRLWKLNADREEALLTRGAGTERDLLESQTRLTEARIGVSRAEQRLRNLGLSAEQIEAVVAGDDTSSMLEVTAPFNALIVERTAVIGEMTGAAQPIFAIADTTAMWAMVDLNESDLGVVTKGVELLLSIDGVARQSFPGRLTWISTELDHKTRTIRARAEFENPDGLLKANMFGRVNIQAGQNRQAVTIPKAAVQWEGCCNVAFVKVDDDATHFMPVRLTLGFDAGDRYEVIAGLTGGETIVTRGSFILKNELLKDAVGAGCCEVGHLDE